MRCFWLSLIVGTRARRLVFRAATLIPVLQALELFEVGLLNVLHCGIEMGASELVVYGQ